MAKICIPKKNNDKCNLRAIMKNINNGYATTWEDYQIEKPKYESLITALMKGGIVLKSKRKDKPTNEYTIADIDKYSEWEKGDFYRLIQKNIIPLLPAIAGLVKESIKTI